MSTFPKPIQQLAIPLLFAAISGLAVAFFTGALTFSKLTSWVLPSTSIVSPIKETAPDEKSDKKSEYVAVYLSNGKVYFGKLGRQDDEELVLTDVFFLTLTRTQEEKKPSSEEGSAEGATVESSPQGDFQLVRLADQFQAPEDRLTLSTSHILFWESLRSDSRVVEAIKKYHETKK